MRAIDLTGRVVGRWTVLERVENSRQGGTQWLCRCECGVTAVVNGIVLRDKRSQSCGCRKTEMVVERSTTHGHATKGISPTYRSWASMKARCSNPDNVRYADYGGRGISVCERWLVFENFLADMGPKPKKGMSIDRVDNNGNYEPGNCRWTNAKVQNNNRRSNRLISFEGRTQSQQAWALEFGVSHSTIHRYLKEWTPDELFSVLEEIKQESRSNSRNPP